MPAKPEKNPAPPANGDVMLTSRDLARRWGMNEGSIRVMRSEGRGPKYITLGRRSRGKRPRVRYWKSVIERYEQENGRPQ
jgi:hypothetical protein